VRHESGVQRLLDFREWRIVDELVVDRSIPDAVIERGQLIGTNFIAVNSRRGGIGGRRFGPCGFGRGGDRRRRGGPEKVTPRQFRQFEILCFAAAPMRIA
jgi:hypothetical protein